ncbi:hypothetical protein HN51_054821 [Arachis hypogaea]|uniref:Pentatricopeptide repeat-containing protein n=3 Tax=Arachis hypogaea TaxID=3818 RepID=A0A444XLA1_ARAHY|nr:pentatricopeptide repeat-containing protein At3g48250, chloroplastic [Arachis ipaensis]XP_020967954.1 pentatricopeptide repeat-containing protein At3g48250, chloroplastic [Arachis ipaensis]XP_020967955.1 pentatricopeptide repeat-containing protein At3g48250, chloroplastic [Arachis ipaensis]XP_025675428.1 pentatricopeptide repeat-containing protein At3g48250, chloroplastic [Arachis hypogaea]XP_025675429.1 pentatricopeptide repeat-containing protein At3g48250, chloroplastic [Arachis hypogaea]
MMNRLKPIARSLRLRFLELPLATRLIATRSLQHSLNQVTRSSFSASSTAAPTVSSLSYHHSCNFRFPSIHHRFFFSSKPSSILELVSANDWSQGLELELDKCSPSLTHETVLYILRRLDKNPQKASCFFSWVSEKQWFIPSSSVYSLIVRILANKETMKQFWVTLRMMKEKGFFLDEETYVTISMRFKKEKMDSDCVALNHFYHRMLEENAMQGLVKKVVGVVSASKWGDEVANGLEKLNIQLSDNFVIRVLKELRTQPSKAFEFFHWAGKQFGFEHNTITYNAIARVLARTDSVEEFWNILEEMKSVGHELDIDTYVKISRQFRKSRMVENSVKLYELMMDSSYKPSVQDCVILLKSISECDFPDLNLVFRVAKKYESTGHTLSKAIYDSIHRSLTSLGKFSEAEKIVHTMRNAGYEPDNITYSQLVFGLCKTRRLEEACKVLDEMESCGCIPDIKTWTILIKGHCDAKEVDKALLCFSKMVKKGCDVDADLLDFLVDGFLGQERVEGAYKLLVEVVSTYRISPWQATYKNLIERLLGVGKLENAFDLLRLMKTHNYPPYTEPFVSYISKFGTVEDAAEFLKALSMKKYPSVASYLHVFESFFREGRLYEAKDLLYKCPHHIRQDSKIAELFSSNKSHAATN